MTGRLGRYTGPPSPVTLTTARTLVPSGDRRITDVASGNTGDIVARVLRDATAANPAHVARLAAALKGATPAATLANVYAFVRSQITYRLDPDSVQDVKTPARVVLDGYADCKGLSILTTALLAGAGIQSAFRFVAYGPGEFTHVYALAYPHGPATPVVLDTCLSKLGSEVANHHKSDFMTQIRSISGLGRGNAAADLHDTYGAVAGADDGTALGLHGHESEPEFELKLHREGLLLERAAVQAVAGIGATGPLDEAIYDTNRAIAAASIGDGDALEGIGSDVLRRYREKVRARAGRPLTRGHRRWLELKRKHGPATVGSLDEVVEVSGIGRRKRRGGLFKRLGSKLKKAGNKLKNAARSVANRAKALAKKAGKNLLKVAKFAFKAVTLPQRLFVKAMAEVMLPKLAPMFLYLFIKNPQTLASLPAKVKRKRKKAEKFAKFMINVIGMKEAHFMKIIRNGIQRRHKATPEQVLGRTVKGAITGIGSVEGLYGIGEGADMVSMALQIIQKLASLFGKKPGEDETPTGDDLPAESDWDTGETKSGRMVQAEMYTQPVTTKGEEPADPEDHATEQAAQNRALTRVQNESDDTPANAPVPGSDEAEAGEADTDGGGRGFKRATARRGAVADDGDGPGADDNDGPDHSGGPGGIPKPLLYAGAAAASYLLLRGSGKSK